MMMDLLGKERTLDLFKRIIRAKQDELNACRRTFNEMQSEKATAIHDLLVVAGYRPILTTDESKIKRYFDEHRP